MASQPTPDNDALKGLGTQFGGEISSKNNALDDQRSVQEWTVWLGLDPGLDDYDRQKKHLQTLEPGTGRWLLGSPKFQEWMASDQSSTLCCYGIPGAGKTVMTSLVIETLRNQFSMEDGVAVAFHYLGPDRRDSPALVLSEVLRQIILSARSVGGRGTLGALLQKHRKGLERPTEDDLLEILISIISERYQTVFIVLDGLDALGLAEQRRLLAALERLQQLAGQTVKLFLTSRDRGRGALREGPRFASLEIRASADDVALHVDSRIRSGLPLIAKDPILWRQIRETIVKMADGMFLIAYLAMQSLARKQTREDVKEALDTFNQHRFQALDDIYNHLFEKVHSVTPEPIQQMLQRILSWLLLANRRLSRAELRDVLCWSDGGAPYYFRSALFFLESWIVESGEDGTIDLIHSTAKEYLRQMHPTLCSPEVEVEILNSCVRYLARSEFGEGACSSEGELSRRREMFPFYSYAAKHWGNHALRPPVAGLGVTEPTRYFLWCQAQVAAAGQALSDDFNVWKPKALHLASYLGILNISRFLLTDAVFLQSPEEGDDKGRTPLAWAAHNGHIDVMTLLLQHGAHIDAQDNTGSTVLSFAISQQDHECARNTARFLIDLGGNVNSQDNYGVTPLSYACQRRHIGVAELLLQRGADVNLRDHNKRSPLWQAARKGHFLMVKLLLHHGADPTAEDVRRETPLVAAIRSGAGNVVQQLLDAGAIVSDRPKLVLLARKLGHPGCANILRGLRSDGTDRETDSESDVSTNFADGAPVSVTGRDNIGDDTHTEYSEIGPFTDAQRERLIIGLAVGLASRVLPEKGRTDDTIRPIDAATAGRMTVALRGYLKDFALKIGYKARDDDAKKVMYIVHKYNRQIAEAFETECLLNGIQLPRRETSPAASLTEYSEDGPLEGIDAREKVLQWREKVIPTTGEDDATEYVSDRDNKDEAGGVADYLSLITDTPAYHCLVGYLRRELYLTHSEPSVMAEVGLRIASSIAQQKRVTWRKAATSHCMVFELDWDPQVFVWDQKINDEGGNAVAMAITITGSANDAQALSCSQYLAQTWPGTGPEVLELIKGAVRDGASSRTSLSHGARLEANIQGAKLIIKVTGVRPALVELGEQLAWLGATLRSSPSEDGSRVFYCRPRIKQRKTSIPPSPFVHWRFHFDLFEMPQADASAFELHNGRCWFGLFRRPVVVQGYPIRQKPKESAGLEIGLSLAAELAQAPGAAVFDGRVVLKGFCVILVLVEQVQDTLFWHLISNEHQRPMSYRDPRIVHLGTHFSEDGPSILPGLGKSRHVVGWCSKARGLAGELEPNYDIKLSRLDTADDIERFPSLSFKQVSSENDTRLATRDIGEAYGDPLDGFYRNRIAEMAQNFFVFYDAEEHRGWLIEGATALLHIVRASLQLDQDPLNNPTYFNQFVFEMTEYNENNVPRLGTRAASVLSYRMNAELPLFNTHGPYITFRKRVEVICEKLVLALDTQRTINRRPWHEAENSIQGYDFRQISMNNTNDGEVPAVMLNLATERRLTWLHLTRRLNAPILFGRGFGDLIRPQDTHGLCKAWHELPRGLGHLAVLGSDLNVILETRGGCREQVPWRVVQDVCWFDPGCVFKVCPTTQRRWYSFKVPKKAHYGRSHDYCEVAQVLAPRGSPLVAGFNSQSYKPVRDKLGPRCAVIFGSPEQLEGDGSEDPASSNPEIRLPPSRASETSRGPGRSYSGFGDASQLLRSTQSYIPYASSQTPSEFGGLTRRSPRAASPAPPVTRPSTIGYFGISIGILATLAASYWDSSFYARTAFLSLLAMLLWGRLVFYISPGSSWKGWLARRVIFFFLLAWCLVLSPLHLLWSPLDLWIKYEVHPPFDPYQIIYAPEGTIDIDVFAIHGLGSNPNSAWRHRRSGDGSTVDWLTEVLPRQKGCQEIRITLLNHQTRWDSRTAQVDFTTHAKSMLSYVERLNEGKRPIIFIGHSFGGLLLKQLLIYASTESREIAKMTRGILFLGVPHHGSRYSLIARLMACTAAWRGSSTTLLEFVAQGNKELRTLDDRFARIYAGRGGHVSLVGTAPYIANLIETLPEGFGKLSLSPTVTLEDGELTYGKQAILGTDHRGLNKYPSAEDPGFREFFVHFNASCHHEWER